MHASKCNTSQALSPYWFYLRSGYHGWNNVLILFYICHYHLFKGEVDVIVLRYSLQMLFGHCLGIIEDKYVPSHRGLDIICLCVLQWAHSESTPGLHSSAKKWAAVWIFLAGYLGWEIGQRAEIYLHMSVPQSFLFCRSVFARRGVYN